MIHVISYNVMGCENPGAVRETLESFPTNTFVALQETNAHSIETLIREIFPNAAVTFHNDMISTEHRTGVTTIAPMEPTKAVKIELPRLQGAFWKWFFKRDNSEVPQHRAVLTKYLLSDGSELTLVNAHLEVFGWKRHKLRQVKALKEFLQKQGSGKVVILGDFNSNNVAWIEGVLGKGFKLIGKPKTITSSIEHTMSSVLSKRRWVYKLLKKRVLNRVFDSRKDWILVKGLIPNKDGVLQEHKGSDHYPIWATFK